MDEAYPIVSGPSTKALQAIVAGDRRTLIFEILADGGSQRNGQAPKSRKTTFSCSPFADSFKLELKEKGADGYIWSIELRNPMYGNVVIRFNSSEGDGMLILGN